MSADSKDIVVYALKAKCQEADSGRRLIGTVQVAYNADTAMYKEKLMPDGHDGFLSPDAALEIFKSLYVKKGISHLDYLRIERDISAEKDICPQHPIICIMKGD